MKILEFQVQSVVSGWGRSELYCNGQVFVVNEVDLWLSWSFHSKVDATGNAGLFTVNDDSVLLGGLPFRDVWSANLHFIDISLVSLIVSRHPTIERTTDYVSAVILHMDFIISAHSWSICHVDWPVLIVTEIDLWFGWTSRSQFVINYFIIKINSFEYHFDWQKYKLVNQNTIGRKFLLKQVKMIKMKYLQKRQWVRWHFCHSLILWTY